MLLTSDDEVQSYIEKIMAQVKKWIYGGKINKLIIVIVSKSTVEAVEKWEFDVEVKKAQASSEFLVEEEEVTKSKEETQREIQSLVRQITSLVSYLPMLKEDEYSFNVLVHTDPNDPHIPREWCEGEEKLIQGENIESVQFRSFSTNIHQIGTQVSYVYEK